MLLGITLALAADCEPLGSGEFRDYVVDAVNGLERDDVEVTRNIITVLTRRMLCLDHAPESRLLADLRVVQSVLAFADGTDWQGPLGAALRIRPGVDRIVGRAHPTYAWEPKTQSSFAPFVSKGFVYVDGKKVADLPLDSGWYVIQRSNGVEWNTHLIRGSEPSVGWAASPVELPAALELDGWIGVIAGGAVSQQSFVASRRDGAPYTGVSAYDFGDNLFNRGVYGIQAEGKSWFYGPLGLAVSGEYLLGLGTSMLSGRGLLIAKMGAIRVGVGVGAADTVVFRRVNTIPDGEEPVGEPVAEAYFGGFGAVRLSYVAGQREQLEIGVELGIRPPARQRYEGHVLYTFPAGRGRVATTLGGFVRGSKNHFIAVVTDEIKLTLSTVQVGVSLGGRFRSRL